MCRMEKFPGHGLCPDFSGPGRPARSMHIPGPIPDPIQNFHFSPFPIWKSLIGRFSNRKWRQWGRSWWNWLFYLKEMRFALDRYGSRGHFLFENQSYRFSNRKWAKTRIPRGRDAILSTQRILRGRDPILSIQRIFKRDDVTENGDFTRLQGTQFFRYLILSYFIYTNNFLRKSRIIQWYIQTFSALRAPIC